MYLTGIVTGLDLVDYGQEPTSRALSPALASAPPPDPDPDAAALATAQAGARAPKRQRKPSAKAATSRDD